MLTITLDTCCFDNTKCYAELKELKKLHEKGEIEVGVDYIAYSEKMRYAASNKASHIKHLKDMAMMHGFNQEDLSMQEIPEDKTIDEVISDDQVEYNKIFKKVRAIHSPEFSGDKIKNLNDLSPEKQYNKSNDWRMLSWHIYHNRDFFVTNDESGFIREGKNDTEDKKKKRFESKFGGLKIRKLNEHFIKELKEKFD
jgi:hypothetical protein